LVAVLLCGLLYVLYSRVDLVVFFFLNHLAFQAGLFAGIFKEAFFAEFRQKLITVVNLVLAVVQLIFVLALFWWANIYLYGAAILAAGMLTALVWWIIAKKKLHFRFVPRVEWKKISFASLKDFALWTHLTSAANRATYQFDVVILSLFVSLKLVAAYTIALTVANLFLLFPQVLQRAAILGIANLESKESIGEATGIFLKYFFLLSLAEFIFFYWFGNLIVGLYHPEDLSLVFGLSGMPNSSTASSRCSLRSSSASSRMDLLTRVGWGICSKTKWTFSPAVWISTLP
jgi:O-antigen/teichoic acid export membrane protein